VRVAYFFNEWSSFEMKKEILAVCAVLMIGISACGGGGGGDDGDSQEPAPSDPAPSTPSYQQNLPPDPGGAATATLAGVDTNANGIRDDLERDAAMTASTEDSFNATVSLIKTLQQTIDPSTSEANVAQVAQSVFCAMEKRSASAANDDLPEDVLRALVFDTKERKEAYRAYIRAYGVHITFEEEISCEL
jgi:hypothetical protein